LLAHVLGVARIKLYTDYERPLSERELERVRELVRRAAEHEPIAYLTGVAHFFGLEFEVNRDVLIPRPDTETLVEQVLQLARNQPGMEAPRVLDLCTGSGCIAAAIAHQLKSATVIATDISAGAVTVARRNVQRLGLSERISVEQGDLYGALRHIVDPRPFELIVANPPYIRKAQVAELDRNVRDYEPAAALDGGTDGLDPHRRILTGAPERLTSGGRIYLEIAFDQGDSARQIAQDHQAFGEVRILKDHGGNDRVLTARRR
jgi:release factor glutamine methyltransferase